MPTRLAAMGDPLKGLCDLMDAMLTEIEQLRLDCAKWAAIFESNKTRFPADVETPKAAGE